MKVVFGVILFIGVVGIATAFPKDVFDDVLAVENAIENYEKYEYNSLKIQPRVAVDGMLTVPQLFKKYGYPNEVHIVQTPDGYLLEVHRLARKGGIPVLLVHGLIDSSAGFVINGPKKALAYILYDLGYDVWLANCRGNKYSRKHVYLNPDSTAFWDFSFHELGVFDVPAMIDYIVLNTKIDKIHYVAHSQGVTALFVMCDQRPGYCNKILSVNALAPVVYVSHVTSPLIKIVATFIDPLEFLGKIFRIGEYLPNNSIMRMAGQVLCKKEAITQPLCENLLFLITGYDSDQLNKTLLPVILSHIPAGGSVKEMVHVSQMVNSGKFRMFDHGWFTNLSKYGTIQPPQYNLSNVTAPVALHYAMNDWLVDTKDVLKLSTELPNLIGKYLVPIPKFNHLDFLFAISSKIAVYDEVAKIMKSAEEQ